MMMVFNKTKIDVINTRYKIPSTKALMNNSCWKKLSNEARDLVKDSILAKSIVVFIPLALGLMMYFPVKCIVHDTRSIDCIIIAAVLGLAIVGIISLTIAVKCTKSMQQVESAKAPTVEQDAEFTASNPIHSKP